MVPALGTLVENQTLGPSHEHFREYTFIPHGIQSYHLMSPGPVLGVRHEQRQSHGPEAALRPGPGASHSTCLWAF